MTKSVVNISGHTRRSPEDNLLIKAGEPTSYNGSTVAYDETTQCWLLNNRNVGSLSSLSRELGLMKEAHDIGKYLESKGYKFSASFDEQTKADWNERECYFAVWGYDQLDLDRCVVKQHLYNEIADLIGRTSKAVEWKIQNVSACDPRTRTEKPISEAPNKQSLLIQVFETYWKDRVSARQLYPLYVQEAQFDVPSSTEKVAKLKSIIIEEGAPGFRESLRRKRSATLLDKGRQHFRSLEPDNRLRCKACDFSTPLELSREIVQMHHTVPIADSGDEGRKFHIEAALQLMLPLCPTCHQIAHTSSPPLELADIKLLRGA